MMELVTKMLGTVVSVQLDIMGLDVMIRVVTVTVLPVIRALATVQVIVPVDSISLGAWKHALLVVRTVVIGTMEYVTLVKKDFGGVTATIIVLHNARTTSVIRRVVTVQKGVSLISMVIIVMQPALRIVGVVVNR